jgi:hypothetical protein
MLANLFAPAALAADGFCYSKIDVNCDWIVDGQDLSYLLGAWGTGDRTLDFDGDCTVGGGDLAYMLGNWGALPAPPEWQDMHFVNEEVTLCLGGDSVHAVLDRNIGDVRMTLERQQGPCGQKRHRFTRRRCCSLRQ